MCQINILGYPSAFLDITSAVQFIFLDYLVRMNAAKHCIDVLSDITRPGDLTTYSAGPKTGKLYQNAIWKDFGTVDYRTELNEMRRIHRFRPTERWYTSFSCFSYVIDFLKQINRLNSILRMFELIYFSAKAAERSTLSTNSGYLKATFYGHTLFWFSVFVRILLLRDGDGLKRWSRCLAFSIFFISTTQPRDADCI